MMMATPPADFRRHRFLEMVAPRCQARNIRTGKRSCPHPSRFVIRAPYDELLVCGIHRRAWTRAASYPIGEAWRATPKTSDVQG